MPLKDVARVDRFKIFQQFVILASDRYDLAHTQQNNKRRQNTGEEKVCLCWRWFVRSCLTMTRWWSWWWWRGRWWWWWWVMRWLRWRGQLSWSWGRPQQLGGALNKASTYFPFNARAVKGANCNKQSDKVQSQNSLLCICSLLHYIRILTLWCYNSKSGANWNTEWLVSGIHLPFIMHTLWHTMHKCTCSWIMKMNQIYADMHKCTELAWCRRSVDCGSNYL